MSENELNALMFAINEKAMQAQTKVNEYKHDFMFYKGQYQAYTEVYTMLTNIKTRQDEQ
jgi:hypothetical protein